MTILSLQERLSLFLLLEGSKKNHSPNNCNALTLYPPSYLFNSLNPHDASKKHETVLILTTHFFHLPPTSIHLYSLQVENCASNSRLVVGEDNNGKFRFERVKFSPDWIQAGENYSYLFNLGHTNANFDV